MLFFYFLIKVIIYSFCTYLYICRMMIWQIGENLGLLSPPCQFQIRKGPKSAGLLLLLGGWGSTMLLQTQKKVNVTKIFDIIPLI